MINKKKEEKKYIYISLRFSTVLTILANFILVQKHVNLGIFESTLLNSTKYLPDCQQL